MGKEWTAPMQWDNEGTPPSASLVKSGFQAYYKPPANIFNYFLHRYKACVEELQAEADSINDTKATKTELTEKANELKGAIDAKAAKTDVDNVVEELQESIGGKAPTSHAASGTTYGVASASLYGHAKASGTTPKAHGTAAAGSETAAFARGDHVHPMQEAGVGITTAGSGAAYTATVSGITALTAGASFMMIPHTVSTAVMPTLNVNNLGAKNVRRRLSGSTTATTTGSSASWLTANKPVRMTYDGTYWIADVTQPNANDIYGTLPIASGGTGGATAEEAREALGITPANIGAASRTLLTTTIGTGWSGGYAPYTQVVTVDGIFETDTPHISPVYSSTIELAIAQKEAWAMVCKAETGNGSITFTCFEEAPSVAIPIQIEVVS